MSFPKSLKAQLQAVASAAAIMGFCLSDVSNVDAAVEPGAACAASKQKAAAKKLSDKVKCHGVAIKKEQPVDPACLTKAETKFEGSFAKAEDKGGCATTGDVDEVELLIDDVLAQLLAALPPVAEDCDNDGDDDGDGFVDCDDHDCNSDPLCNTTESICDDAVDNDADGFTDCDDADCVAAPACVATETFCDDTVDNDGDGFTDCSDADCVAAPACVATETICDDTVDNDTDGFTDCDDFDCASDPLCP
jgi:hypothetical protein